MDRTDRTYSDFDKSGWDTQVAESVTDGTDRGCS